MAETSPPLAPPLDAYQTAKPNEPIWTVQGGDPLGGPLLRVWAAFARIQAGVITAGAVEGIFEGLRKAATRNKPDQQHEQEALLLRATLTEQISWDMDAYRAGFADETPDPNPPAENVSTPAERQRLDQYDHRRRFAERVSYMVGELNQMRQPLIDLEFMKPEGELDHAIQGTMLTLQSISRVIKPQRLIAPTPEQNNGE